MPRARPTITHVGSKAVRAAIELGAGTSSRRAGLAAMAAALGIVMAGATLPTSLYGLYSVRFDLSESMVTVIFATYAVGVLLALLLLGRLSDQAGRRRMMLVGLMLSALSSGCFLLAESVAPMLLGRFVSGLSAGIVTGTATAAILELALPERRDQATLWATAANMGGLGAGPLVGGLAAQVAGDPLRAVFLLHLAVLAPAAATVWLAPETVRPSSVRFRLQRLRLPDGTRDVFFSAALAGSTGFAVLGVFTAVTPAFLREVLAITDPAAIGLVVSAIYGSSTVAQLLLDRIGVDAALRFGVTAMACGLTAFGTGLLLGSLALVLLGVVLAGAGQGLSFRAGMVVVTGLAAAEQRAEVTSAFFVVLYVAVAAPVIGVGLLADAATVRTAGVVFAVAVVAASLGAGIWLKRSVPRPRTAHHRPQRRSPTQ